MNDITTAATDMAKILTTPMSMFLHDTSVIGSLHQQSDIFAGPGAGLQCVANSVCALLRSTQKQPNRWTSADIDDILIRGHNLYLHIGLMRRLLPSDVPQTISMNNVTYLIKEYTSHIGSFSRPNVQFQICTIDMLHRVMLSHTHFLLCIGDSCVSIIRDMYHVYYICDSHSRNVAGFPTYGGTAILMKFNSFSRMTKYLKEVGRCFNTDRFELTIMQITPMRNLEVRLLKNTQPMCTHSSTATDKAQLPDEGENKYTKLNKERLLRDTIDNQKPHPLASAASTSSEHLRHQKQCEHPINHKHDEGDNAHRRNYMKQYMRERRQDANFRSQEAIYRRNKRQSEQFQLDKSLTGMEYMKQSMRAKINHDKQQSTTAPLNTSINTMTTVQSHQLPSQNISNCSTIQPHHNRYDKYNQHDVNCITKDTQMRTHSIANVDRKRGHKEVKNIHEKVSTKRKALSILRDNKRLKTERTQPETHNLIEDNINGTQTTQSKQTYDKLQQSSESVTPPSQKNSCDHYQEQHLSKRPKSTSITQHQEHKQPQNVNFKLKEAYILLERCPIPQHTMLKKICCEKQTNSSSPCKTGTHKVNKIKLDTDQCREPNITVEKTKHKKSTLSTPQHATSERTYIGNKPRYSSQSDTERRRPNKKKLKSFDLPISNAVGKEKKLIETTTTYRQQPVQTVRKSMSIQDQCPQMTVTQEEQIHPSYILKDTGSTNNGGDTKRTENERNYISNKRQNPEYREREQNYIHNKRENPQYKKRELIHMKQKRESAQYKAKEAKHIQEKRTNVHYQQKELAAMQHKRKQPLYKEQERTNKQQKRMDPVYKQQEAKHKKYGHNFQDSISIFHKKIELGCIFVCSVCHQTHFEDSVVPVENLRPSTHTDLLHECLTGYKSEGDTEFICLTCKRHIYKGVIPKLSIKNKCGFPPKPPELCLHPLEEVLIAPVIPFMTIRELPTGGQKSMKGNVCHIPVDVSPTINSLPRNLSETQTVSVKMKRKKCYKTAVFSENIRPVKVVKALKYLMDTSDIFQQHTVDVDDTWLSRITQTETDDTCYLDPEFRSLHQMHTDHQSTGEHGNTTDQDTEDEEDENDCNAPCAGTLLDEQHIDPHTMSLTYAPGEGKKPIFNEPDMEYLCFPTIFCGQRRASNEERTIPVRDTELFKYELCSADTRVACHIPNIFWKMKHKQTKQIVGKVSLAMRRNKTKGKKITAALLLNKEERNNIVKLDEGYLIFRQLRNSPPYYDMKKKDVMAMVRQLGIPALFYSLSAADTKWNNFLISLGKLVDNITYTTQQIDEMSWTDKCRLISEHPAACARYFHHRVQKFETHILKSPYSPFGDMQHNFYRVEFQHRGSPHVHGLMWIKDAPKYDIATDQDVCTYIDNIISCSSNVSPEDMKYLELQRHRHSKTCKKKIRGVTVCRFGAPWPPMSDTTILKPLDDNALHDIDSYKEMNARIYEKLNALTECDRNITLEQFLEQLNVSKDMYILALRSTLTKPKIFLKRQVCDMYINGYMKNMLSVWQANHDIQFVLDAFSCVVYICDYMTKSHKGMSELLAKACEEAKQGNMSLKQSVRHMGNKFLNCVETSAQECCYDLLELPFTKSTVKTEFISTCEPDERIFIAKDEAILKEMNPDSEDVRQPGNIERYANRPKQLEHWCLADYVSLLDIRYKNQPVEEDDDDVDYEITSPTCDNDGTSELHECNIFPLNIGRGKALYRRKVGKVIRGVGYKFKLDPVNYCREKLLLYTCWRNELVDLYHGKDTYMEAYQLKETIIQGKMKTYEPLSEQLDTAIEMLIDESARDAPDAVVPNPDGDDEDPGELASISNTLEIYDPDRPTYQQLGDIGPQLNLPPTTFEDSVEMIANIMSDDVYRSHLQSLNRQQQEFFTHVMSEQAKRENQVLCCLTGGAGTGKSHVLKALYQALYRCLCTEVGQSRDSIRILVAAPTGKAAYNVKGSTIHGAFHIPANQPLSKYQPLSYDTLNTYHAKYRLLEWILLDEVSMVSNDLLRYIHLRLQQIKHSNEPFGGVNVVAIGDLFQLQPVKANFIFLDLRNAYGALAVNLWCEYFTVYELTEIMRQRNDKLFAELLNRLRVGEHTKEDIETLNTRVITSEQLKSLHHMPHFFPTKERVNHYNELVLEDSNEYQVKVTAIDILPNGISDKFRDSLEIAVSKRSPQSTGGLPKVITVATNHQYDLISNVAVEDGLMNGAECCIKYIEFHRNATFPAIVWVKFEDDLIGTTQRQKYSYLHKRSQVRPDWTPLFAHKRSFSVKGVWITRVQFPLRQAAARTIHVAQSATYDNIYIDMETTKNPPAIWWHHMHYVALSRVTSLEGLHIGNLNAKRISVSHQVHEYMKDARGKYKLQLSYTPLHALPDTQLKIVYHNVRSYRKHYNDVKHNYNFKDADIIVIAESWLSLRDNTSDYLIHGYNMFRLDDINVASPHHGLLLYVRNSLNVTCLRKYPGRHIEAIHITLKHQDVLCNIIGTYISPHASADAIHAFFDDILTESTCQPLIVIGDFNIDVNETRNTHFCRYMRNFYNLEQQVHESTTQSQTLIDLVFSNNQLDHVSTIHTYWSDHKMISVGVDVTKLKANQRHQQNGTLERIRCYNCLKDFASKLGLRNHSKFSRCEKVRRSQHDV